MMKRVLSVPSLNLLLRGPRERPGTMSKLRNYGIDGCYLFGLFTAMALIVGTLWLAVWVSAPMAEDDPGWNCYAHGNRICNEPAAELTAWTAWDRNTNTADLVAQYPSGFRVEYVGTSILSPKLGAGERSVLWEDGRWYVFRTSPLHDKSLTYPDKS